MQLSKLLHQTVSFLLPPPSTLPGAPSLMCIIANFFDKFTTSNRREIKLSWANVFPLQVNKPLSSHNFPNACITPYAYLESVKTRYNSQSLTRAYSSAVWADQVGGNLPSSFNCLPFTIEYPVNFFPSITLEDPSINTFSPSGQGVFCKSSLAPVWRWSPEYSHGLLPGPSLQSHSNRRLGWTLPFF